MRSFLLASLKLLGGVLLFSGVTFSQPVFDSPVNLGGPVNTPWYESDPFWDAPRKRLYFVRASPATINGGEDIYYSNWNDGGWWNPPISVGTQINTGEIEHSPSVSPDGKKLYYIGFSRPGWPYAWDIWVSTWDSSMNAWDTPVNIGCPISTPVVEFSAKIGPDGKTLYFHSQQSTCDSFPQFSGLVSSVWDSFTGWSTPQDLGSNINVDGEQYPSVTQDGQWLYFERGVADGISIFVSPWTGSMWGPAFDLRPEIGERAVTPSITPSGDTLFFSTPLLNSIGSNDIFMMGRIPTGVTDNEIHLPRGFELYQNYPNPFNGETRIQLFVSGSLKGPVKLIVYNILGQPVRHLLKDEVIIGKTVQVWDGRDDSGKEVSSGIYLYELKVGSRRSVKRAVLMR